MFGRGREEVKNPGLVLIYYVKALIVMFVFILGDLFEVTLRLVIGCIFFALMVFTLLPRMGFGFSDDGLRTVLMTGIAFVLCNVAFTIGNSLLEFVYLADIDDSDIEEV